MLRLKMLLSKTSVKKYEAMMQARCNDGRTHGLLQFYGANRTGRWAGRLVQVQNLPRNTMEELDDARALLRRGDTDALEMLFDDPPDVLSQLIRTAFIPAERMRFTVADFSAIEARVIAWLAGEKWRMDVFADGGDIYCASASKMFHVPVEKHGVNGHLRQKGKVAELALGYGGGVSASRKSSRAGEKRVRVSCDFGAISKVPPLRLYESGQQYRCSMASNSSAVPAYCSSDSLQGAALPMSNLASNTKRASIARG